MNWPMDMLGDTLVDGVEAKMQLGLRTAVMDSLLRQDREYFGESKGPACRCFHLFSMCLHCLFPCVMSHSRFRAATLTTRTVVWGRVADHNQSGVLQERLNKDTEDLARTIIQQPKNLISAITRVAAKSAFLYNCSPQLFWLGISIPVPFCVILNTLGWKVIRKSHKKISKVNDQAAGSTAEILRKHTPAVSQEPPFSSTRALDFSRPTGALRVCVFQVRSRPSDSLGWRTKSGAGARFIGTPRDQTKTSPCGEGRLFRTARP